MTLFKQDDWVTKTILFLASQTLSLLGSSVVGFAMIWYLTLETSSGIVMTISTLCTFLPQILISLFAGVWADRYNRKYLIIISDTFIALSTLILAMCFILGYGSLTLIFFISVIRSIGAGIQMPAVGAILPQLVPQDKLLKVNGMNSTINSVMMLISPAIGGAILAVWGFEATLFLDVITASIAVVILSCLSVAKHQRNDDSAPLTIFEDLKLGLNYTRNHPLIKHLLIFYGIFFLLITPAAYLTPLMVERIFGPQVWRLTANEISWSLGAAIGGIIVAYKGHFGNKIHVMAISCLGFGVCFSILGFCNNFTLYLIIMLIAGGFMPFFSAAETVLIQEKVEPYMLGRVFSIIQIIVSITMPFGMIIFGPLADLIAIEYIIIASGLMLIMLAIYIYKSRLSDLV